MKILQPGAELRVLTSLAARDGHHLGLEVGELHDADVLARAWRRVGLVLTEHGPAGRDEVLISGSSWARRMAADQRRTVVSIRGRLGVGLG